MFYLSDIFRLFWICSIVFNENLKISESFVYSSTYWPTKNNNYDIYYDYWRPSLQQKLYPFHYDDLPTSYNSYLSSTIPSEPLLSPPSSNNQFLSPPSPSSSSSLLSAPLLSSTSPAARPISSSKPPSSSSSISYILNDPLKTNLIYHPSSQATYPQSPPQALPPQPPPPPPPPPPQSSSSSSSSMSSSSPIDIVSLFGNKAKNVKKNGFWKLLKKKKPIKKDTYLYEDNSEHYYHHHHHHHYFHHYINNPKSGKIRNLWNKFAKKKPSKEKTRDNIKEYELITNSCKHGPILHTTTGHLIENRLQNHSINYHLPYSDDEYLNSLTFNDESNKKSIDMHKQHTKPIN